MSDPSWQASVLSPAMPVSLDLSVNSEEREQGDSEPSQTDLPARSDSLCCKVAFADQPAPMHIAVLVMCDKPLLMQTCCGPSFAVDPIPGNAGWIANE